MEIKNEAKFMQKEYFWKKEKVVSFHTVGCGKHFFMKKNSYNMKKV